MSKKARPSVALALIGLLGLLAAGCGSNASSQGDAGTAGSTGTASSTAGASSGSATTLTARDKAVKFAECIRAHGVSDFPDPDANNQFEYGISVSPEVWAKAVNACKALQPPGTLSGKRTPKQQSASLRFAECIRDHGVKDFPDPVNGEPLVDTRKIPSANASGGMAVLNAAMHKCRAVMQEVLGGRG